MQKNLKILQTTKFRQQKKIWRKIDMRSTNNVQPFVVIFEGSRADIDVSGNRTTTLVKPTIPGMRLHVQRLLQKQAITFQENVKEVNQSKCKTVKQ